MAEPASLQVAVLPAASPEWMPRSVVDAGGTLAPVDSADALIWGGTKPDGLRQILEDHPNVRWVQLPAAGVEPYADLLKDGRIWTSAKGAFGDQVAEHALALALAGFRDLPQRARAKSWGEKGGQTLIGKKVTIVGAGGIAQSSIRLLAPFQCEITIVRHHLEPLPGASRLFDSKGLLPAIEDADLVVLAAALTPESKGMIDEPELRAMQPHTWIVNVGRGSLIVTPALVRALTQGRIGGAALDVTDPEPLPTGHPLWSLSNCLITPHTANPPQLEDEDMAQRISENVHRRLTGQPLVGVVSGANGY